MAGSTPGDAFIALSHRLCDGYGAIRANQAITLGHDILEEFDGGVVLSGARNCDVARIVTAVVGRGGDHRRNRRDRVDGHGEYLRGSQGVTSLVDRKSTR